MTPAPTWPPPRLAPAYRVEPVATERGTRDEQETAWLHFNDWLDRPVAVFAVRRRPLTGANAAAVLHCVGGAQTVHPQDLAVWNDAGFAAATFDWQVTGVGGRPPERTTRYPSALVAQFHPTPALAAAVLPVALQAAAVCLDWLGRTPGVDPTRLGVVGISWGGYLTWLLAAYEPRVRALVAAFGCGGLFAPERPPAAHAPEVRAFWAQHWEPAALGHRITAPACYLSGTNDFFGDPLVAQRLLASLPAPHVHHLLPNVDHSLDATQSRLALAWIRHHLLGDPAVPALPSLQPDLTLTTDPAHPILGHEIWWAEPAGPAVFRCWQPSPPPRDRPVLAFARVRYAAGVELCTPLQTLAPEAHSAPPLLPRPAAIPFGLGWRWEVGNARLFSNDAHANPPATPEAPWTLTPARPATDAPIGVILHLDPAAIARLPAEAPLKLAWSPPPTGEVILHLHLRSRPPEPIELRTTASGPTIVIPPAASGWSDVGRIQITATIPGRPPFSVGPLRASG